MPYMMPPSASVGQVYFADGTAAFVVGGFVLVPPAQVGAMLAAGFILPSGVYPNGVTAVPFALTEEITLSTGGLTSDSVANLLPANAYIQRIEAVVSTTITTTTDWKMGDGTTAARFSAANATLIAGTKQTGADHLDNNGVSGPHQKNAAKLRITCTGANPGAGKIVVTVFGYTS